MRSEPGLNDPFEEAIDDTLSSLSSDLRAAMSNVEIVVEDEPPAGRPLLGLYHGVPLPRRSSTYSGVLPDKTSDCSKCQVCGPRPGQRTQRDERETVQRRGTFHRAARRRSRLLLRSGARRGRLRRRSLAVPLALAQSASRI